ncbi:uncharacterized protein F4812DRAFT_447443 [Daldinia caldariorum]|uniref:uncharacterized protein n=1 Tax=Daldinia caldariorum TaxID=326644 RepID=UPI0020077491|nr:uncharacterized protein F4812DRAFT_447443 [Daldinia caldariorum]KAI1463200.1 hypothetical protein F4812DRAFT_447443 [Daldinia caldariorum]
MAFPWRFTQVSLMRCVDLRIPKCKAHKLNKRLLWVRQWDRRTPLKVLMLAAYFSALTLASIYLSAGLNIDIAAFVVIVLNRSWSSAECFFDFQYLEMDTPLLYPSNTPVEDNRIRKGWDVATILVHSVSAEGMLGFCIYKQLQLPTSGPEFSLLILYFICLPGEVMSLCCCFQTTNHTCTYFLHRLRYHRGIGRVESLEMTS